MKNFKIFERLKRELKKPKYKRRNFKMKLLALISIPAIMVGCSTKVNNGSSRNNNSSNYVQEYSSYDNNINYTTKTELDAFTQQIIKQDIKFNDSNSLEIHNFIDSVDAEYNYSDLYGLDKAYEKYTNTQSYLGINNTDIISDNQVDVDYLYNIVLKNNDKYISDKENVLYSKLSDSEVKKICEILVDTINKELACPDFNGNIADISANLLNLKILNGAAISNAFVTDDDALVVSLTSMENMKLFADNEDAYEITVAHEVEHILQKRSLKALENEQIERGHGYCKKFNDLTVNSLYHVWLIEGSAESLAVRLYNCEPLTYKNKVSYINSLKFTQLLKDDFNLYDIERLTQQNSLDQVFETFNCKSDTEKVELLNMLYSLEVIQESPDDFIELYEKEVLNGQKVTDKDIDNLYYNLKASVCVTLTKYFYKNLTYKITRDGLNINEIYDLISLFEEDLANHTLYSEESQLQYNKIFINKYTEIQNLFFENISKNLNLNVDDIISTYRDYNSTITYHLDSALNYQIQEINISDISQDKNKFLSQLRLRYIKERTLSIGEVSEKMSLNLNK